MEIYGWEQMQEWINLIKKTGKFNHHFSDDPDAAILREEQVRKMYLDKSGIIWIGTGSAFFTEETTGGLFKLDPRTGEIDIYRNSEQKNSLIDNRVKAIFEDSKGTFWIGTAGDGLHTMNREDGTFTRHMYDPQNPKKLSRSPMSMQGNSKRHTTHNYFFTRWGTGI